MKNILITVLVVIAILTAVGVGGYKACGYRLSGKSTVTAKVTDKTVKKSGSKKEKYLIFTDKGTFENTDDFLNGKSNSSDFYGGIEVGKTYLFTIKGPRSGFFSMYPNILDYKVVSEY